MLLCPVLSLEEPFDPNYMQALFDYGYALGRGGYPWQKVPPGYHGLAGR